MEQAGIDTSWMGPDEENYTIPEPDFREVLHVIMIYGFANISFIYSFVFFYSQNHNSSPDNTYEKTGMEDYDFVDVEGDQEHLQSRGIRKKENVLEEDLQFSSEDDFDEVPFTGEVHNEPMDVDTLDIGKFQCSKLNTITHL